MNTGWGWGLFPNEEDQEIPMRGRGFRGRGCGRGGFQRDSDEYDMSRRGGWGGRVSFRGRGMRGRGWRGRIDPFSMNASLPISYPMSPPMMSSPKYNSEYSSDSYEPPL